MIGSTEKAVLESMAQRLGVASADLYQLIDFESKWNPAAKNPLSSARGLIQFTDSTAQSLGFKNSLDLVNKNPSVLDQLPIVEKYLNRYKPYSGKQSLFMAVFYPKARNWNPNQQFSEKVQKANPGIRTPADYVAFVERRSTLAAIPLIIAAGAFLLYTLLKGKVLA